jgi:hypothetical protein
MGSGSVWCTDGLTLPPGFAAAADTVTTAWRNSLLGGSPSETLIPHGRMYLQGCACGMRGSLRANCESVVAAQS